MVGFFVRRFVKDYENTADERVRQGYGTVASITGICLNVLLFLGKYLAGQISGSIAITADAFNNLSDAGSSVITLLGFRIAAKKPDPNHPYGHGRMEYVAGLIVSFAILLMGIELFRSSVEKILSPEPVDGSLAAILVLAASIGVKIYMFYYNRKLGKKIHSAAMKATSMDSLSDSAATFVVLVSVMVMKVTGINLDGVSGLLVSAFILYAGYGAAKETISPLLGQSPEPEFVQAVENLVMAHPEVIGIHDLIVHDYGPGRRMISLHGEVPGDGDIFVLHDVIDSIEKELQEKLGCSAVIHMDPIATDDETVNAMKEKVLEAVGKISPEITIHDFRIVHGPTHTNVIFDAVVPFGFHMEDDEVKKALEKAVREMEGNCYPVITIDKGYSGV